MIGAEDRAAFQSRGLIGLRNFLPAEKVDRARRAALGCRDPKGLGRHEDIANLIGAEAHRAAAELLDLGDALPFRGSLHVLFTGPNASIWTVPHGNWHLDLPRLPGRGVPGVQIFTFLDTVAPGCGGTLVVTGSHRLVNQDRRISSAAVKAILKREPWFRDLLCADFPDRLRFIREPGRVGDIEVQVAELHGEPGDAFFMDIRLLHTTAPNAARTPRIMLTQHFVRESVRVAMES